jgi:hypothetical protein
MPKGTEVNKKPTSKTKKKAAVAAKKKGAAAAVEVPTLPTLPTVPTPRKVYKPRKTSARSPIRRPKPPESLFADVALVSRATNVAQKYLRSIITVNYQDLLSMAIQAAQEAASKLTPLAVAQRVLKERVKIASGTIEELREELGKKGKGKGRGKGKGQHVETATATAAVTPATSATSATATATTPALTKRRGRPKGSKNLPKPVTKPSTAPGPAPALASSSKPKPKPQVAAPVAAVSKRPSLSLSNPLHKLQAEHDHGHAAPAKRGGKIQLGPVAVDRNRASKIVDRGNSVDEDEGNED